MGTLYTWDKFYVIGLAEDDRLLSAIQNSILTYEKCQANNANPTASSLSSEQKEPLVTKIKIKQQTAENYSEKLWKLQKFETVSEKKTHLISGSAGPSDE